MMKKSKIAIGVVVGLGILWAGGAWYTGKQVEQHIDEIVSNINQSLKQNYPEAGLHVTREGYQRHLFSSQTQLVVTSTLPAGNGDALLAADERVVFNETISHGPLPLAQLRHFNFIPALASLHSELVNTPKVKALFAATGGDSPVEAVTRLGFSHSTDSTIHIKPLKYISESMSVTSQAAEIDVKTDQQQNLRLSGQSGDLVIIYPTQNGNQASLTGQGLHLDSATRISDQGLRIGSHQIAIRHLLYAVDSSALLQLDGVQGESNLDIHNDRLKGNLNYQVDGVRWHNLPLGNAALKLSLDNLSANGLKTFYDRYNAAVEKSLSEAQKTTDEAKLQALQDDLDRTVLDNVPQLLQGGARFAVEGLTVKNGKGESQFSLQANFNDPQVSSSVSKDTTSLLDHYVKQLDAKLTINRAMATEFVNILAQSQGFDAPQAQRLAKQQIDGFAALGEMFHLTHASDQQINSTISYQQGQVKVNNDSMTLAQFVQRYLPTSSVTPSQPTSPAMPTDQ